MPEACFYDFTKDVTDHPLMRRILLLESHGSFCNLVHPFSSELHWTSFKKGENLFFSHIKQVTNFDSELKTVLWEYHPYFAFVLRLEFSTVSVNFSAVRLNHILKLVI